jgi:hypothetical protein
MLYFSLHAINLHSPQPTLIPRFVRLLQVNEITIFRNHFNSYSASSEDCADSSSSPLEPSRRWLNILLIPLVSGLHFQWGLLLLPPNDPLLLPGPPARKHLRTLRRESAPLSLLPIPPPETPTSGSPSLILTVNLSYNSPYKSNAWRKPYFLPRLPAQPVSGNWRNRWHPSPPNSTVRANNKMLPQPPTNQPATTPKGEGPPHAPPLSAHAHQPPHARINQPPTTSLGLRALPQQLDITRHLLPPSHANKRNVHHLHSFLNLSPVPTERS